jgi:hypothetical protein
MDAILEAVKNSTGFKTFIGFAAEAVIPQNASGLRSNLIISKAVYVGS